MNGIFLSTAAFQGLSTGAKQEVLACIGVGTAPKSPRHDPARGVTYRAADEDGPVELTVALVRKLTDKLSPKTLNTLKLIAANEGPEFRLNGIVAATDGAQNYLDLRGVWSALTRRTRNITDENADLIWWDAVPDDAGGPIDHVGRIAPLTHNSLRTHFGL